MEVTTRQVSLGIIVMMLTLLVIAMALLLWQHGLGVHAPVIGHTSSHIIRGAIASRCLPGNCPNP